MTRVSSRPEMLRWACERADRELSDLADRVPGLIAWERGEKKPTLKQFEDFADATHVPFGYLFLSEPPKENIPIPDFRPVGERVRRPGPNLLDIIYSIQQRVAWLREERLECEADPIEFVGSAKLSDDPSGVGREMRRALGLGDGWAAAALIDRLLHHCHIVNIRGNSYRMREHQALLRPDSEESREGDRW